MIIQMNRRVDDIVLMLMHLHLLLVESLMLLLLLLTTTGIHLLVMLLVVMVVFLANNVLHLLTFERSSRGSERHGVNLCVFWFRFACFVDFM